MKQLYTEIQSPITTNGVIVNNQLYNQHFPIDLANLNNPDYSQFNSNLQSNGRLGSPFPFLIFEIGSPKTGTTSLNHFFRFNNIPGIHYADEYRRRNYPNYRQLWDLRKLSNRNFYLNKSKKNKQKIYNNNSNKTKLNQTYLIEKIKQEHTYCIENKRNVNFKRSEKQHTQDVDHDFDDENDKRRYQYQYRDNKLIDKNPKLKVSFNLNSTINNMDKTRDRWHRSKLKHKHTQQIATVNADDNSDSIDISDGKLKNISKYDSLDDEKKKHACIVDGAGYLQRLRLFYGLEERYMYYGEFGPFGIMSDFQPNIYRFELLFINYPNCKYIWNLRPIKRRLKSLFFKFNRKNINIYYNHKTIKNVQNVSNNQWFEYFVSTVIDWYTPQCAFYKQFVVKQKLVEKHQMVIFELETDSIDKIIDFFKPWLILDKKHWLHKNTAIQQRTSTENSKEQATYDDIQAKWQHLITEYPMILENEKDLKQTELQRMIEICLYSGEFKW